MNPLSENALMQLFRDVAEQSTFGIFIAALDGTIEYANPRYEIISGYAAASLLGRNVRQFRAEEAASEVFEQLWVTVLGGQVWHGELLNRRQDGAPYWERLRVSPVLDAAGRIAHVCATVEERDAQKDLVLGGHLATFDSLTGLPTRPQFMKRLATTIEDAHAAQHGFALLHIDLDQFRACNDDLGHIGADQVLVGIADRLKQSVRKGDGLARVGSDEFDVILHDTEDVALCEEMARRLLVEIARPLHIDAHELSMTASIGIARYPLDGTDAESLLRNADNALLCARREGGNDWRFFQSSMADLAVGRLDLTSQLRHAVDSGQLVLHYQPQVSLLSGEVVGLEALVRWQHPDKGLLSPGTFIPLAEESGLIVAIGEWVLFEACRQAKLWQTAGLPTVRMAVNLSARHFRQSNLPETVSATLLAHGLEARYLELELTESAMMQDAAKAVHIIDRLKSLGLCLSLDDFGTGYSSLAYLSRFAIDQIKIDQSFVRDITVNPVNASIATATIAMAHKLGKNVIAEGVETEAQMNFLRRHGCDEMQGYWFSRPVPAADIEVMLKSGRKLDIATNDEDSGHTLLLVDDEPNILAALKRVFRREGYRILTADSGAAGLELLATHSVQVVVSDQRMPEMTGTEFLSRVKELYPDTVRIVLSGYSEIHTLTDAINRGAIWKYFTKPWEDEQIKEDVRRAFRLSAT